MTLPLHIRIRNGGSTEQTKACRPPLADTLALPLASGLGEKRPFLGQV